MVLSLQVGKYRLATKLHSSLNLGISFLILKTCIEF